MTRRFTFLLLNALCRKDEKTGFIRSMCTARAFAQTAKNFVQLYVAGEKKKPLRV
jgi:hypothetical protein